MAHDSSDVNMLGPNFRFVASFKEMRDLGTNTPIEYRSAHSFPSHHNHFLFVNIATPNEVASCFLSSLKKGDWPGVEND